MTASYKKLRDGSWGILVEYSNAYINAGDTVVVTKRSGEQSREVVSSVIWRGKGVCICSISPKQNSTQKYRDNDQCTCPQCSSGSECLCVYGRG